MYVTYSRQILMVNKIPLYTRPIYNTKYISFQNVSVTLLKHKLTFPFSTSQVNYFYKHGTFKIVCTCRAVARIFFGGVRSLERKGYFCQRFSVAVKSIYNQLRHDNSLLL